MSYVLKAGQDCSLNKEDFYPNVWDKIRDYLTPQAVEEAKFRVLSMTITPELAERLNRYIDREKLETYSQTTKNRRQVRFSYTPNFSVKIYKKNNGECSMCLIDSGARGYYKGKYRQSEYEEKRAKSMTMMEIYFSILKKYPKHLLDISCITENVDDYKDVPF
jgi:hypothetical protein